MRKEGAGFDLPMAVCARRRGILNLVVPRDNAAEAVVVEGVNVFGMRRLAEVVRLLTPQRPKTQIGDIARLKNAAP